MERQKIKWDNHTGIKRNENRVASFYPIRGTEFYEVQKIQSRVSHKCYVRYLEGIDTNCYIRYNGTVYAINSVIDVDFEHKMLEIYCYERVNKEEIPDEQ